MGDTGDQGGAIDSGGEIGGHICRPSVCEGSTVGGPTTTLGGLCTLKWLWGGEVGRDVHCGGRGRQRKRLSPHWERHCGRYNEGNNTGTGQRNAVI